jgi:hypothetical protein
MKLLVTKLYEVTEEIEVSDDLANELGYDDFIDEITRAAHIIVHMDDNRLVTTNAKWVATTVIDEQRDDFCVAHWARD